jgi:phosphohistidine phosphatase
MILYLVRHGIAEDRIKFGLKINNDKLRPLTVDGRKKFAKGFHHLKKLFGRVDLIVASPLLRAQQTAKIISADYSQTKFKTSTVLRPDAEPSEFCKWLEVNMKNNDTKVVVVGHEPQLSILAGWLLFGFRKSRIKIKKGGCLAIEIIGNVGSESGVLLWAVTPKTLGVN